MSGDGLLSWGRYPRHPQRPLPVHWLAELPQRLAEARAAHGTTLAYGAGRSYGDSCLAASDQVLLTRPLDRFIAADWKAGTLTVEAGATLGEILALTIPRGWFLPVTPGTQHATVGGAIANDVHGKNHHRRGSFGHHLRRFALLRSDDGLVEVSPTQRPELFAATVGGLGLTGVIAWAELALLPIASSHVDTLTQRFGSLDDFFALSGELDAAHEFAVSWIDCVARGAAAGRGVYVAGDFAADGPLDLPPRPRRTLPFTPPVSLVNRASLRAFNLAYWHRAPARRRAARVGHEPFFYPLDAIAGWNRLYGPAGFQQYQALLPPPAARDAVAAMLAAIASGGDGSFLAVLKRCGDLPAPGLLSFTAPGLTLALDFPQHERLERVLFPRLDAIVREAGGRLYPAKDAHGSGADFRRAYPAWERLEALRDPALLSRFWQRMLP